ncbi:MAG: NAD-dependent epimerase/dehydratase family protein, partial [Planctomycetota bacterium]
MTRKSVLITGARGFIGSALARSVSKSGCRVAGLGHGAIPPKRQSRIGLSDWVNGDIEHANLQQLVSRTGSYDQIFHLAGASHVGRSFEYPAEDFSRTVAAAGNLFEWLRLNCPDLTVVVVSSAAFYGAG